MARVTLTITDTQHGPVLRWNGLPDSPDKGTAAQRLGATLSNALRAILAQRTGAPPVAKDKPDGAAAFAASVREAVNTMERDARKGGKS